MNYKTANFGFKKLRQASFFHSLMDETWMNGHEYSLQNAGFCYIFTDFHIILNWTFWLMINFIRLNFGLYHNMKVHILDVLTHLQWEK